MSATASNLQTQSQTRNPILWGAYLACSWTWCIGMFFPVLLMRDHGWTGFLIFAIPNVLGAAAMGWVLRSKAESVSFVEKHPAAVWWFSAITLAFHVFWIVWITSFIRRAFPLPDQYLAGVAAVVISFFIVSGRAVRFGRSAQLAMVLIVFSLGALICTFAAPFWSQPSDDLARIAPDPTGAYWMLPVSVFGFLLCPYLDITFHHARQQLDTRARGRIGFTIGFILFFALMIVLTTRYAGVVVGAMDQSRFVPIAAPWLGGIIMVHILCQWIFTVRVHLKRMQSIPGKTPNQTTMYAFALFAGLAGLFATKLPMHSGLSGGEIMYRIFLSAYGLLLPTYMLYRVILAHMSGSKIGSTTMWIAVALASPMFWMGFIERQQIWLVPGMGVVALGAFYLYIQGMKSRESSLTHE